MLDNDIIRATLKNELDKLGLEKEEEQQLINELNFLSSFVVEFYIKGKGSDKRKTSRSE